MAAGPRGKEPGAHEDTQACCATTNHCCADSDTALKSGPASSTTRRRTRIRPRHRAAPERHQVGPCPDRETSSHQIKAIPGPAREERAANRRPGTVTVPSGEGSSNGASCAKQETHFLSPLRTLHPGQNGGGGAPTSLIYPTSSCYWRLQGCDSSVRLPLTPRVPPTPPHVPPDPWSMTSPSSKGSAACGNTNYAQEKNLEGLGPAGTAPQTPGPELGVLG